MDGTEDSDLGWLGVSCEETESLLDSGRTSGGGTLTLSDNLVSPLFLLLRVTFPSSANCVCLFAPDLNEFLRDPPVSASAIFPSSNRLCLSLTETFSLFSVFVSEMPRLRAESDILCLFCLREAGGELSAASSVSFFTPQVALPLGERRDTLGDVDPFLNVGEEF